jgi:hypothetical protein
MGFSIFKRAPRENRRAAFLDRAIPLNGASHAEVVEYSVDIPMRYAECFAKLADGRTVRLKDSRQFLAWSGRDVKRSFLFCSGRRRIEIQTDVRNRVGNVQAGHVFGVINWLFLMVGANDAPLHNHAARKFIARDGSQLVVPYWGQILARRIGRRAPMQCEAILDAHGLTSAAPG